MPQIINTNIASLNAQRNLNSSQAATNQALERLSSGLRINSAKDDAAGLAISTRFQSQINGLNVAIRNVGDGVSLAQTAEGALGAMTDSLQRIRELALQSSNGTNSDADRQALNSETQQLIAEITRAGSQTNFNGLNLLDGSFKSVFQVGANSGETISVSIGKLTADTLGVSTKSGVSAIATTSALAGGDLVINGVSIGASRASDDTASTANQSASAIAKAAAVNRATGQTGVTAIVDKNTAAGSAMTASVTSGTVVVNGTSIGIETTNDATSSRAAVVSAINAQSSLTGVTAVDSGDDALGVSLVAADGRNITTVLTGVTSASTGLGAQGTKTGGFTLVAGSDTREISIAGANLSNAGLVAGTFTAGVSGVSSTARVANAFQAATSAARTGTVAFTSNDFSDGSQSAAATVVGSIDRSAGGDFSDDRALATGTVSLTSFSNDFTPTGSSAKLTGNVNLLAGVNFANAVGDDVSFRLSVVDGGSVDILLSADYSAATGTGAQGMLDQINTAIDGASLGFTASIDKTTGFLTFTEDTATGKTAIFTETVSGDAGTEAKAILGFTVLASQTATGTAGTSAGRFTVKFDSAAASVETEIVLNSNYTSGSQLAAAINSQVSGGAVTLDSDGKLQFKSATTGVASTVTIDDFRGNANTAALLGLAAPVIANGDGAATDVAFTVDVSGTSYDVALTKNYTTGASFLSAINTQLSGSGVTATLDSSGFLLLTEDVLEGKVITVADNGGGANQSVQINLSTVASANGFASAGADNATFDVSVDGGTAVKVNVNDNNTTFALLKAEIEGQVSGITVTQNADNKVVFTSNATGLASSVQISNLGGSAASVLGLEVGTTTGVNAVDPSFKNLVSGDLVINGVSINGAKNASDSASYVSNSSSKKASGIAIAAAINESTGATGVTATVNATTAKGTSAATAGTPASSGTLYLNGVSVSLTTQSGADANRTFLVNQVNSVAGQTGVTAEDNGTSVTLTAADGRNIVMALDTNGGAVSAANFGLAGAGISETDFTVGATGLTRANSDAKTTYSTVSLTSAGAIDLSGGTNGNSALSSLGLSQGTFGGGIAGQYLTEVDISTQAGANAALTAVDNALNAVNSARADLGAIQNRFETTISNLAVTSENLSAANSRILDADFAAEAAALSRSQILQQAGISILAQANAAPQQVLSLLQ